MSNEKNVPAEIVENVAKTSPDEPAKLPAEPVATLEERLLAFNEGMRALTASCGLSIGAEPYLDGDAIRVRVVAVEAVVDNGSVKL